MFCAHKSVVVKFNKSSNLKSLPAIGGLGVAVTSTPSIIME